MTHKESFYFSHDSNARHDERIVPLRFKLGWEGYGIYWALVEKLREVSGFKLKKDYEMIGYDLNVTVECIRSVVEDFNLFKTDKHYFWSESLRHRMLIVKEKSIKARMSAFAKHGLPETDANGVRTHSGRSAINKRKGKEIKGKENTTWLTDYAVIYELKCNAEIPYGQAAKYLKMVEERIGHEKAVICFKRYCDKTPVTFISLKRFQETLKGWEDAGNIEEEEHTGKF